MEKLMVKVTSSSTSEPCVAAQASPHMLHHRPTFNIVRPVERLVDLLR